MSVLCQYHAVLGFSCVSAGKKSACNGGDLGSIPGLESPWRKERLPTPVFWSRESHGLYSLWGWKELDTTEQLSHHITSSCCFDYCSFVVL